MNFSDLYKLAVSVGFPAGDPSRIAAAIALAESGGNPGAIGDQTLGGSYGLWQINHPAHPGYDIDALLDPTYNAKAALAVSNGGTTWSPWSTYNSGAYKNYLAPAPDVASWQPFAIAMGILLAAGATVYYINEMPIPSRRRRVFA